MYNPSFPSTDTSQNTDTSSFSDNFNSTIAYNTVSYDHDPGFGLSGFGVSGFDYPMFGDNHTQFQELEHLSCFNAQDPVVNMISTTQDMADIGHGSSSSSFGFACKPFVGSDGDWCSSTERDLTENIHIEHNTATKRAKFGDESYVVAFRTLSEFENLDDGYKWRKYGKKMLKTTRHPRNYYKCSNERCKVKKRVERDEEDNRHVLTTYQGRHNHQCPSLLYSCHTTLGVLTYASPASNSLI